MAVELPEGVVEEAARLLWELPGRGPFLEAGDVNQATYREKAWRLLHCVKPILPAIIAQEREKWEAEQEVELALLGVEKCSGEGIGFHNARAEKAKDERDKAKAQALAELREQIAPLLDEYREALEAFCRQEPGSGLRFRKIETRILSTLDQEGEDG